MASLPLILVLVSAITPLLMIKYQKIGHFPLQLIARCRWLSLMPPQIDAFRSLRQPLLLRLLILSSLFSFSSSLAIAGQLIDTLSCHTEGWLLAFAVVTPFADIAIGYWLNTYIIIYFSFITCILLLILLLLLLLFHYCHYYYFISFDY